MQFVKRHYSEIMAQLCYDPLSKECELVMADALTLFVQAKMADSDLRLDRFLLDYFRKVKLGEHVFQRSYEFISGSDHNKKMFISLFWKTYHHLAFTAEPLTEADYYNILLLLCPDIPRSLVGSAFMTNKSIEDRLFFIDFIYLFQLCFYFNNFVYCFRDNLVFYDRLLSRDSVLDVASNVLASLFVPSNSSNAGPSLNAIKSALSHVDHFDSWKSVQECLARSDSINNAVGILPLRATMADHDSLRTLIPTEWGGRRTVQPTLLTLTAHSSTATSNVDGNQQDNRHNSIMKTSVSSSSLSSTNKLLKRPSRQLKLTQNSLSGQGDAESVFNSEQSSVAENSSTTGTIPAYGTQRQSLRGGQKPRLPNISALTSSGNGSLNNRLHISSSMPTNLSSQVVDEQSSSEDDDHSSSVSSDNN